MTAACAKVAMINSFENVGFFEKNKKQFVVAFMDYALLDKLIGCFWDYCNSFRGLHTQPPVFYPPISYPIDPNQKPCPGPSQRNHHDISFSA